MAKEEEEEELPLRVVRTSVSEATITNYHTPWDLQTTSLFVTVWKLRSPGLGASRV